MPYKQMLSFSCTHEVTKLAFFFFAQKANIIGGRRLKYYQMPYQSLQYAPPFDITKQYEVFVP